MLISFREDNCFQDESSYCDTPINNARFVAYETKVEKNNTRKNTLFFIDLMCILGTRFLRKQRTDKEKVKLRCKLPHGNLQK